MGSVAGCQLQAVLDGKGRDHRVAASDRPADTIKVTSDRPARSAASWSKGRISSGTMAMRNAWMRFGEAPTFCKPWMISITVIESNPPQTARFQPARLGGFLP